MPLAKFGNATKVGDVFADDHAKSHIRFTPLHNLSRRKNANGVGIQQKHEHSAGTRTINPRCEGFDYQCLSSKIAIGICGNYNIDEGQGSEQKKGI